MGYFPDTPSEQDVKPLRKLTEATEKGQHCSIAFVIQMTGISILLPNKATHPAFKITFYEAGVKVHYLQCDVKKDALEIVI